MSPDNRKAPRSRVHLRVAYKRGDDVLEKYAENLSAGGLFVRDAEGLAARDVVALEIELPKHGVFRVNAEVMHVTSAGAGMQLKSPPGVFATSLAAYLQRLEQRTVANVFVDLDPWRRALAEAGYRVQSLPSPHELVGVLGDAHGLLVFDEIAEQYRSALAFLGHDDALVIALHAKLPVEAVLAQLDDKLLGNSSVTAAEG